MVKNVHVETVYLSKISNNLTIKANILQSAISEPIKEIFITGKQSYKSFLIMKVVILIIFGIFVKFSFEVTRTFSTLLRFTEINDVLHQTHKVHSKQLAGFDDLPSFLAKQVPLRLKTIF